MAMSVYYSTFCGEIVHESRGGVESFYVPDTLGNTAQLWDINGNKTDEWTYWPFGEVRTRTGTTATPFTFIGTLGYYLDQLANRFYVRARYFRQTLARWQTVDPLWPQQFPYGYADNAPAYITDASGLASSTNGTAYFGCSHAYYSASWAPYFVGNYPVAEIVSFDLRVCFCPRDANAAKDTITVLGGIIAAILTIIGVFCKACAIGAVVAGAIVGLILTLIYAWVSICQRISHASDWSCVEVVGTLSLNLTLIGPRFILLAYPTCCQCINITPTPPSGPNS